MSQSIPTSLTIHPSPLDLTVGQSQQLSVTVLDQRGQPYVGPLPVVFTSHIATCATVSSKGLISAVAPGTAAIQVTCGTASGGTFPNIRI